MTIHPSVDFFSFDTVIKLDDGAARLGKTSLFAGRMFGRGDFHQKRDKEIRH